MIPSTLATTDFVPTNDYISARRMSSRSASRLMMTRCSRQRRVTPLQDDLRDSRGTCTLEGHLRAVIGQMKLTDIITDRAVFSERVQ